MFFKDKFNTEIQTIIRNMNEVGATTTLGSFDTNLFLKTRIIQPNGKDYIKVVPLVMFDWIKSSNPNDVVVENKMVLCENKKGTVITCGRDSV